MFLGSRGATGVTMSNTVPSVASLPPAAPWLARWSPAAAFPPSSSSLLPCL